MSVLAQLASSLGRPDEEPNIALARDIARRDDRDAVRELVAALSARGTDVPNDCIKVLYEIGAIKPRLIQNYVPEFIGLLSSRNNRLVWGAMTALGSIAPLQAAAIGKHASAVMAATEKGSVITQDSGIRVLATVAGLDRVQGARILPFLERFLRSCPAKDLPRHAESILPALNAGNRADVSWILEQRLPELTEAQAKRARKTAGAIKAL